MSVDIYTASPTGPRFISQADCCVLIPDECAKVPSLLKHIRTQVKALSDTIPAPGTQQIDGLDRGALGGKRFSLLWKSLP